MNRKNKIDQSLQFKRKPTMGIPPSNSDTTDYLRKSKWGYVGAIVLESKYNTQVHFWKDRFTGNVYISNAARRIQEQYDAKT